MLAIVETIRGVPPISFDILRSALSNIFALINKGHSCYNSTTRFNMRMFLVLMLWHVSGALNLFYLPCTCSRKNFCCFVDSSVIAIQLL